MRNGNGISYFRELEMEAEGWTGREGKQVSVLTGEWIVYDFPHTADVRAYECLRLQLDGASETPIWLEAELEPLQSGRPELIRKAAASVCVPPGCRMVCIPYSAFDQSALVSAYLKYISRVRLRIRAGSVRLLHASFAMERDFWAQAENVTRTAQSGEELEWNVLLVNASDRPVYVTSCRISEGRESLDPVFPEMVFLASKEEKEIVVRCRMTEQIPPGGYEELRLMWIPDGDGGRSCTTTLYAARTMKHPFLIHTEDGWRRLKTGLQADPALQERFQREYAGPASSWKVSRPNPDKAWVYESAEQDLFLKTAIAWQVTGRGEYFDKLLTYVKGFLDPQRGYLSTEFSYFQFTESEEEFAKGTFPVRHAVSAGWVQEGEFMTKLAIVCDLLWDCPEFTADMHAELEKCMRSYMEFESWRLLDGDGNNFQLSEASAALFFACLLQDRPAIERFLAGTNGLYELLGSVLSDDGSYFEGASNYMRLAAEILLHAAVACENYGLNLKDMWVDASHDRYVIHAPWAARRESGPQAKPFLGMSFERAMPTERPVRRLKDFVDNLMRLATDRGILFSANDSNEKDLVPVMELAYYLYRDESYLPIARLDGHRDILFGKHMLGEVYVPGKRTEFNTGNGFAVLRSGGGRTQAVLKHGQHGGYHGHYDRLSLVSVIHDNRTFHNMEFSWYSYASFLFKMWVQTSLAHNMVVVDRRMQEPSVCRCIYQVSDADGFQAVCAQTVSRWSDPPYGGQTPYMERFPEEKCAKEGRYILLPAQPRPQGEIGEYSEEIFQRRLLILIDNCCFVWDYEEAEHEHIYECCYHPFGSVKMEGVSETGFTEYMDADPFGAGQFIRSCHWYDSQGTVKLGFYNTQSRVNPNDIIDFTEHVNLYGVYPQSGTVMLGRYPERKDTFAAGENCGIRELAADPCKKTAAFHQKGRCARFVTALEVGDENIREIVCSSYERIIFERHDGSRWEICVRGMDDRKREAVSVEYHRTGSEV